MHHSFAFSFACALVGSILVFLGFEQSDFHVALCSFGCRHFLLHVSVGIEQLLRFFRHGFLQVFVFLLGSLNEEGIVEVYDVAVGTVVGIEGFYVELFLRINEFRLYVVEQSPVS